MSAGLISFDIFDTLLTRAFIRPVDLFLVLGDRASRAAEFRGSPEEFQRQRIQAEERARGSVVSREVTLEQIYSELAAALGWDEEAKARMLGIELGLESDTLYGVSAMRLKVEQERRLQKRIVFISDMYLPSTFLEEILEREGFFQKNDRIFVSCEHGCSKGSGELYKHVARELGVKPADWIHFGDHARNDVVIPRRYGIEASRADECLPRRGETAAMGSLNLGGLRASLLAGALRRARLRWPDEGDENPDAFILGASVAGPILFGFVDWCMSNARAKGVKRLYFVSRDGQILAKVAEVIRAARNHDVEVRYLYGSRQAWHPASFESFSEKEFGWVFAPERHLTLEQVLNRLGLDLGTHLETWRRRGVEPSVNMPASLRREVGRWLLSDGIRVEIERISQAKRNLAIRYLVQERLVDDRDWGMVDIGWAGNLQKSLARLIRGSEGHKAARFWAFYFGLTTAAREEDEFPRLCYWNDPEAGGADIQSLNQAMFEIFTAADHGTVTGYRDGGAGIEPVLACQVNERAVGWGLRAFQSGVMECAKHLAKVQSGTPIEVGDYQIFAKRLFESFYAAPTNREATVLGGYLFSDQQMEDRFDRMTPEWGGWEMILGLVDYRRRPIGWWPEGMLARRFSIPLWSYLTLRNCWRRIRGSRNEAG